MPNKPDGNATFMLDYTIWASSLQYKVNKFTLGLDYFSNLKNYDNNPNIDAVFKDQDTGYVGSVKYDFNKFQLGYYYAHIEKYAVVDYLAQDDWVRWGNSDMTRSSNFSGHEFRAVYKINSKFNMVLRAYFVDGLETTGTTLESGTRIRFDFNIKF